ncbi:adenosine 5'-monophosphoramidase HINT2-like [Dryobates pubescens]|uniref:adenosine 5'-monophosphoramidase HINT2-like n=1 Tax=Dryobates pubescens TaxID=118200 RepID=UPI0023B8F891|nr:adenosine 5'-monophosphoramidase HINT2-like [Dryobates pubescens]
MLLPFQRKRLKAEALWTTQPRTARAGTATRQAERVLLARAASSEPSWSAHRVAALGGTDPAAAARPTSSVSAPRSDPSAPRGNANSLSPGKRQVEEGGPAKGQAKTTGETANRDAGSGGSDVASQWAPRRAWPGGGSAGATAGVVVAEEIFGARAVQPGGVFGKVIGRRSAAYVIDEECLVFLDLSAHAPLLFLVMPAEPIIRLSKAEDSGQSLPGRLVTVGKKRAARLGLSDGFRVAVDEGPEGGQSASRVHLRIAGGHRLGWPPG